MNVGLFIVWLIKSLVGLIDSIIYWVDAELYDLMLDIASAEVFNKQTINTVAERVYQLLALVMLFRLIFAFLSYIINPNDMTDKNKGFGNIIKKIIITLFLIVITPFCFDLSRSLQETIIKDKVIEYFIFGQVKPTNASAGYNMMHTVGKMFVVPYKCPDSGCTADNKPNLEKCDGDWSKNLPFTVNLNGGYTSKGNETGKCGYGYTHYWQQLYDASQVDGIDDQKNIFALMQLGSTGKRDKHLIFGIYVIDEALVDYLFLISTGVGIFIGYMLIVMCIDVAVRSIKLSFYEIIAPVPIISYIGPKDGKDTMLSKWFSEVLKTYADLFTRIAGLQLAVFFINEIITSGVVLNGDGVANIIFVNIFLVIGALTFAKSLPKILEGMGIKFSGGGFNLKKKLTDDMAGSKLLRRAGAAGLGLAGGMAANAYRNASNAHKRNKELKEAMNRAGYDKYNRKNRKEFMRNVDNRQYGNLNERRHYAASQAKNKAMQDARARGLSEEAVQKAGNDAFNKASRDYKRTHAGDYGANILAGGISAAARAATSKDGKIFSGAASGIKGAVDARDLRDKRQEADYGFGTRMADSIRATAGVDTEAKSRANALRDEVSQLQANAYAYQQQASTNLQNFMGLQRITHDADGNERIVNLTQTDLDNYLKNPSEFDMSGMTNSERAMLEQSAQAYKGALDQYAQLQTKITKTNKKIGLYEQEKK